MMQPQSPTPPLCQPLVASFRNFMPPLLRSAARLLALGICGVFAPFGMTLIASDGSATYDEATLRGIVFIDADRGWAVGDLGTALKTEDGGLSWRPLPSGTSRPLDAIGMFNSQRGVAIGGGYQPHTQIGVGTVIWTDNGGETWKPAETEALPPLRHLIIGLGGICIAAGDWSPAHGTAVFSSRNGGQTWDAVLAGVAEPVIGIAGTVDDYVLLADNGELTRVRTEMPAVKVASPQPGRVSVASSERFFWVDRSAGEDRSSQLASIDGGATWEAIAGSAKGSPPLKTLLYANQRWTLAHASPLLHRAEGFSPFQSSVAISDVPMRGMFRLDIDRGWAVGDWGTIAVTRDGGQSWRTVRGGKSRPAVLAVAATADQLPWSLLATESLQNQRRVAVVTASDDPLLRSSLALVGPATHYVWNRLSSSQRIVSPQAYSTCRTAGASPAELLSHTLPVVLVLDQHLSSAEKSAWTQAAVDLGVKRIFETGRSNGQVLHNAAALPNCGKLAGDVWNDALMLLRPGTLAPEALRMGTRFDAINDQLSTDGLAGFVGGDRRYVRAASSSTSRRHLQVLQARTGETAWIESMLVSNAPIDELVKQFEANLPRSAPDNQQRMVWRLIVASKATGNAGLHRAMLGQAARLWPDQPLGRISRLYEDAISSSKEWEAISAGALSLGGSASDGFVQLAGGPGVPVSRRDSVQWSPFQKTPFQASAVGADQPSFTGPASLASDAGSQVRQATAIDELEASPALPANQPKMRSVPKDADRAWAAHPAVRVAGKSVDVASLSGNASVVGDAWSQQWAKLNRSTLGPKTIAATWVATRPYLDGKLDEPIWQSGHRFRLDRESAATVQVAYDADFIYLGIRGPQLENHESTGPRKDAAAKNAPQSNAKPRLRDHLSDSHDRYVIRLDVDGDLLTAYELEFNAKSETRDSADGFSQWHPTWFIALAHVANETVAEIAIKKSDLVGPLQTPGQHWNLSLLRPQPGIAHNAFALPDPERWCRVVFD
ncbi:MAG TPA: hypothetical protein DDZ51_21090 [Planctomycetaceae bacterium]|nr:hypothetical protein [Planctomycetaceae bacterium]